MNNRTRLGRLEKLLHIMQNHNEIFPKIEFDMRVWKCGTAACALGSAGSYPPFRKAGLRTHVEASVTYLGLEGYEAGAEFFGITDEDSHWLFNPDAYPEGKTITPEMVAKRIDILLKNILPTSGKVI